MSAQWTYVDVAAARIQHYISRTPRLKGQRGASAWLSKVTSPQSVRQLLDTPATAGVEVNPEAGEADGVISVRFPEGPDPVPVARTLAASVRAALPAIELDAVWGTGPSYLEAYRDQIKARRAGRPGSLPPLAWLPPPSEFPPLVTCAECRAGPAVDKIDIHEDQNVAVCLDCRARYQDRYRKPGLARHARRGERGDENGDGLPVYREEAALARALGRDPVAGTVQDFSELARLAAEDSNRNHVATIYADGNMIGAFFDRVIAHRDADLKARISAAVSAATRQALLEATRAVAGPADGTRLPVIPHIVGGDDLVVSVTADRAWLFAVTYLGEFRRRLASVDGVPDGLLAPVAPSASAGLVLAHAKFPFRRAAELAGEQLRAAKREFRGEERSRPARCHRRAAHVHAQPWFARAPYRATGTASEQLDASGYDRGRLRGVLVTHCHWDHVSGLDLLQVPIWTNAGELSYAAEARDGAVFRAVSEGHEIHRYEFDNAPYLGFPSSYDVHGDGSVVVALAGGHTTGSVIVFVSLPAGQRYAFIGDVAWQLEGVRRSAERPLLMRKLADVDPGQVREDLLRVASLAGLMQVVPAHDLTAYEGVPRLAAGATSSAP